MPHHSLLPAAGQHSSRTPSPAAASSTSGTLCRWSCTVSLWDSLKGMKRFGKKTKKKSMEKIPVGHLFPRYPPRVFFLPSPEASGPLLWKNCPHVATWGDLTLLRVLRKFFCIVDRDCRDPGAMWQFWSCACMHTHTEIVFWGTSQFGLCRWKWLWMNWCLELMLRKKSKSLK